MADSPHRIDTWVQWALLVLTILGGVWTMGGRLARIEQQLQDNVSIMDAQGKSIERLQTQIIDLTRHVK